MRMKRFVLCLALGIASCAALAQFPFGPLPLLPPEVALDSISAVTIGTQGTQARVRLSVRNPNGIDLPVDSLDYAITLDGRHFSTGTLARPVRLKANAVTPVDVDVVADLNILGNALDRAMRNGGMPYEIDGDVLVAGGLRLPYHRRGEFDPLRGLLR